MNTTRIYSWLEVLAMLVLMYIIIFLKLGAYPLRVWDESYFAVHAIEMWQNQSWFISLYNGEPDFFGSKPFLMNWLQMLCVGAFGVDVVSIRLPSALAAVGCITLVFFFLKRNTSHLTAWIGALVLLSSRGFIGYHTARTGEADTLVSFFLLCQFISIFYLFKSKGASKWIWAFFLSLTLAFMSKAWAGLFFLPAFLIYGLLFERKTLVGLLTKWQSYVGFVGFVGVAVGYFALREHLQPGYLDYVFGWHGGRFFTTVDNHDHPYHYFIQELTRWQYDWWIAPALLGAVIALIGKDINKLFRLAAVTAIVLVLFLGFSKTKTPWYDAPVFPILALLVALPISKLIEVLTQHIQVPYARNLLMLGLFFLPIWDMFLRSQNNHPGGARVHEIKELYLHDRLNNPTGLDGLVVALEYDMAAMLFYKYALAEKGVSIHPQRGIELEEGMRVLVSEDTLLNQIDTTYHVDTLERFRNAWVFKITDEK